MFYLLAPFYIVGFFLSVSPVFGYAEPWQIGLTLLGIVATICFQSWRLLGVVLALSAIYGVWVGDAGALSTAVSSAIGWACMSVVLAARCPRCGYTLAPSRNPFAEGPGRNWCPMCGRTRTRVWPFQYMIKPESWDGSYHDEGGGPGPQDAILHWRRDKLFAQRKKRAVSRVRS